MRRVLSVVALCLCFSVALCHAEEGQDTGNTSQGLSAKLQAAAKKVADSQTFELRYRMSPQEVVRWKVTHLATVATKIRGTEQTEKSRSVSTKVWKVADVDDHGNITFVHFVENVDMWQSVSGRDDIRYNSTTDTVPPPQYEQVAKSLGVPLATITITPHGRIVQRDNAQPTFNTGIGELTVPLPEGPIKIGDQWQIPDELKARMEGGAIKRIQTRQVYRLEKIESGVATISVRTQVITPLNDPKIESQIVERLKNGTVKFDMDAGRLLSKQMDLDKEIVGFQGADSLMQYLARLTEELLTETDSAVANTAAKPVEKK